MVPIPAITLVENSGAGGKSWGSDVDSFIVQQKGDDVAMISIDFTVSPTSKMQGCVAFIVLHVDIGTCCFDQVLHDKGATVRADHVGHRRCPHEKSLAAILQF